MKTTQQPIALSVFVLLGMEVAAYLCGKVASVSCIDITAVPFERVLGARIGKMLQGVRGVAYIHCLVMCVR